MAKHVVKANRYGKQARITLPGLLVKEMKWELEAFFILEKVGQTSVSIKPLRIEDSVDVSRLKPETRRYIESLLDEKDLK